MVRPQYCTFETRFQKDFGGSTNARAARRDRRPRYSCASTLDFRASKAVRVIFEHTLKPRLDFHIAAGNRRSASLFFDLSCQSLIPHRPVSASRNPAGNRAFSTRSRIFPPNPAYSNTRCQTTVRLSLTKEAETVSALKAVGQFRLYDASFSGVPLVSGASAHFALRPLNSVLMAMRRLSIVALS